MTVGEIIQKTGFEVISESDKSKTVEGYYAGDLLSWVMGNAKPGSVWLTIMTNINVLAVASLLDLACVVICENSAIDGDIINTAKEKGINILRTPLPVYDACLMLGSISNA